MKTISHTSKKAASSGSGPGKRKGSAFEHLSAEFGPSMKRRTPRRVGAVDLLIQMRRGEA